MLNPRLACIPSALCALFVYTLEAQKRPMTHADYDGWRHIQNQHLSTDGKFLAYAVFPEEGDGDLIVRDLATGREFRESIGELPPPPPPNYANLNEEGPPPQRGIELAFTRDGRWVVFSSFPSKAEIDQAKKDKKKPADRPRNGLVILDLASGKALRFPNVKSFQVPTKGDSLVAYLRERAYIQMPHDEAKSEKPAKKKEYGGQLVLLNLATGSERALPDVEEFSLAKDGKILVYAVNSSNEDSNGVYSIATSVDALPKTLIAGRGKYSKLAWDEKQTELAFIGGADAKLYLWRPDSGNTEDLVSAATSGFPPTSIVSDKANIAFSKDGQQVFFGYAPKSASVKPAADQAPVEDRVSVDLWSWKDDHIQPMQKVLAQTERNRSYRAVIHLASRKLTVLGDPALQEIVPGDDGGYSLGADDRSYRAMVEYDERYADSYLVDNSTGERKLLASKHIGRISWAPDSRNAIYFDGKDWIAISVPAGKHTNLTAKRGVRFDNEEHDSPGSAPSYGLAGWTKDGRWVLLYDHFDIWKIAPDGSEAKNLTGGAGRKTGVMFRYVKLDTDARLAEPDDKWIDPTKPLLLRAESAETHDSGFYRTTLEAAAQPEKLILAPRNFANPIKARDADVFVTSASTFEEFPDLQVTNGSFHQLHKVSNANPQQATILWGTAELISYRNADGVPLKATLYKPANFDPGKKYPMLVYIYERLTQNVHSYIEPRPYNSINVSYYASNGYLILEPDIVYTTGYPGQSALKCVLPAVQEVVDKGFVNENAIGIQGHSWGGYQIAYMITQTNRFRAVEAGAPVANMTSAYDGIRWGPGIPRQFQYERTQSRIGGSLWQYPMRYIENSPLFQADRIHTPVLMIQNDADDAVPWYQGIEFYLALRRLNKEVYMFTYNGEPHNLRKRQNQKDFALRMQQYFDYWLKGAPKPDWMEHGIPYLDKPNVQAETETDW